MDNPSAHAGNRLGDAFRQTNAPTLVTRALNKSTMAVTELRCDQPNFGRTSGIPREDAYLIGLQLRECPDHDLYFDGKFTRPQNFFAGSTTIYDLRRDPIADIRDPFHSLMFYLPQRALAEITKLHGARTAGELCYQSGAGLHDPVVYHLLSSLRPVLTHSERAPSLFLDHVVLALSFHIAQTYGGVSQNPKATPGTLAPWQERRVKELMAAALREDLPLSRLADECGLSVRHFARAFRRSTGLPPHRWLLHLRVDHAKELLRDNNLSLAEIALACGFADQSHFTRTFTRHTGSPPRVWRRS